MRPTLITLTAPSCSGKSYLLNHIRQVYGAKSTLVSTTTRPARANEQEGVDYYFISDDTYNSILAENGFAEAANYNGVRYGVTKEEFNSKLANENSVAFLIVEPFGMEEYVKYAKSIGARHISVFVDAPYEERITRFSQRVQADLARDLANWEGQLVHPDMVAGLSKFLKATLTRHAAMHAVESQWKAQHAWDIILSGLDSPDVNMLTIENYLQLI